jgi:hypothetical protein
MTKHLGSRKTHWILGRDGQPLYAADVPGYRAETELKSAEQSLAAMEPDLDSHDDFARAIERLRRARAVWGAS